MRSDIDRSVLRSPNPEWGWLGAAFSDARLFAADVPLEEAARSLRGGLSYLAVPYSARARDLDGQWSAIRSEYLAEEAAFWTLQFALAGCTVVAPAHLRASMIAVDRARVVSPLDRSFWWEHRLPLLRACDAVVVPPIQGWKDSIGVWRDACEALSRNRRVFLLANDLERASRRWATVAA